MPAITKWRKGAGVTGENRLKIARLLALIDMLSDRFIGEPASWLEMPIQAGVGITRMDLLGEVDMTSYWRWLVPTLGTVRSNTY